MNRQKYSFLLAKLAYLLSCDCVSTAHNLAQPGQTGLNTVAFLTVLSVRPKRHLCDVNKLLAFDLSEKKEDSPHYLLTSAAVIIPCACSLPSHFIF